MNFRKSQLLGGALLNMFSLQLQFKVGDHILDVNGQSFLDISHSEAVKVLKSSKHMMMTIKDVGKIPFTRTTYDHTEWVTENELPRRPHSAKPTIKYGFYKKNCLKC